MFLNGILHPPVFPDPSLLHCYRLSLLFQYTFSTRFTNNLTKIVFFFPMLNAREISRTVNEALFRRQERRPPWITFFVVGVRLGILHFLVLFIRYLCWRILVCLFYVLYWLYGCVLWICSLPACLCDKIFWDESGYQPPNQLQLSTDPTLFSDSSSGRQLSLLATAPSGFTGTTARHPARGQAHRTALRKNSTVEETLPQLPRATIMLAFQLSQYTSKPGPFAHHLHVQKQSCRIGFIIQAYPVPAGSIHSDFDPLSTPTYPDEWVLDRSKVRQACQRLAKETRSLDRLF